MILRSLNGQFNADGQYNLAAYNLYLNSLVTSVNEVQRAVRIVANAIYETVMREGKWYDDNAARFAKYWNTGEGVIETVDGIPPKKGLASLNQISSLVEKLVKVTAVKVCVEMRNSAQLSDSYKKYNKIKSFSKGDPYIFGIEDLTKKNLKFIEKTECEQNKVLLANEIALNDMITQMSNAFQTISDQLDLIKKLIKVNLLEGQAIRFDGFSLNVLKDYIEEAKESLDNIQLQLYHVLSTDAKVSTDTTNKIKAALGNKYEDWILKN